jgi:hypothetical protein
MTMKTERLCATLGACALLFAARWGWAHHSTAAEFDADKKITFTGKVEKVMWTNPHIYTWVLVRQQDGTDMVYHVEGGAPNGLFRSGWRRDSLHAGDTVTVSGWRSKNPGSPNVGQATITSGDGRRIFSGNGPAKAPE